MARRGLGSVPSQGDNSDKFATTSYVDAGLANKLNTNGTLPFSQITTKPTTLSGYGISDALATSTTFAGDVAGAYNTLSVQKIRGFNIPAPVAGDDQKAVVYDHATTAFKYVAGGGGGEPVITAGTTSQYWRGDKTWQDFDAEVRAAVLTGYSTSSTYSAVSATDTLIAGLQKIEGQINALLINNPITNLTYSSSLNISVSKTDRIFRVTLTGPTTINLSSNNAVDGQQIFLEIKQDATGGRVATLGTGIGYGADITSYTGDTTLNKTDILGFVYNSAAGNFRLIAVAKGY